MGYAKRQRREERARQKTTAENSVLRHGAEPAAVAARHLRAATALTAKGVSFRTSDHSDSNPILDLAKSQIPGIETHTIGDHEGGMIAESSEGELLGAAVIGVAQFGTTKTMFIRWVVTAPDHRGRGIATVLLGLAVHSGLVDDLTIAVGSCSEEGAAFYANTGFTVLKPGVPLPIGDLATGSMGAVGLDNQVFPCAMFCPVK